MGGQIRQVVTADGTASVWVFHPDKPTTTGVILYMDAFGPRPALREMAARMAALGHRVMLPDLFHRFGAYGPFDARTAFTQPEVPADLQSLMDQGRLGEAILQAMALLRQGEAGDLHAVTEGLSVLHQLGMQDVARRTALQLILLDRRG